MPSIDIFDDEQFDVVRLTERINNTPRVASKIADMRLFNEAGITTTQLYIEKNGSGLHLVPAMPRGAPGEPVHLGRPSRVPVQAIHLPQRWSVLADEVQNLRSFSTLQGAPSRAEEVATVGNIVNQKLAKARQQLDLTIEWQRVGVLQGKIYDYDGVSVLLDVYTTFGQTQTVIDMELDSSSTSVRAKCVAIRRAIEAKLGGLSYTGIRALAAPDFMDALTAHASVEKAFERWRDGEFLRTDAGRRGTFEFGDIVWDEYSGSVLSPGGGAGAAEGMPFIPAGTAFAFPTGVSDLFITRFAPADYVETVNTLGLPYYAKQERMRFDKGVDGETQSNPLSICTRPEAIIKLTKQ